MPSEGDVSRDLPPAPLPPCAAVLICRGHPICCRTALFSQSSLCKASPRALRPDRLTCACHQQNKELEKGAEYRQLLVGAIHACAVRFPDVAANVIHLLMVRGRAMNGAAARACGANLNAWATARLAPAAMATTTRVCCSCPT